MQTDLRKPFTALETFRRVPPARVLSMVSHGISIFATAFAAAYLKSSLDLSTVVFALGVGALFVILTECVGRLERAVSLFDSMLLKIDYLRIHDTRDGVEITDAYVYRRAASEAARAKKSVDAFTSYLMEADGPSDDDKSRRTGYFETVLRLATSSSDPITYRRIAQARNPGELVKHYRSANAYTYLRHLARMEELETDGAQVHVKTIDRRRPTTYAIIDNLVLLWQVNQINERNEMQLHGLFVIYDPSNVLITHFRKEFDHYWDGEAKPLRVKHLLGAVS